MDNKVYTFIKELRAGKLKKAHTALEQAVSKKQNLRKTEVTENLAEL